MKLANWLCFCLMSVALPALAAEKSAPRKPASTVNLTDHKAQIIYEALTQAGIGDCGMGSCYAEVDQMSCEQKGRAVNKIYYAASFTIGGDTQSLPGRDAKIIYTALGQAGATSDCGMGSCGYGLLAVRCEAHGLTGMPKPTYSCTITQN